MAESIHESVLVVKATIRLSGEWDFESLDFEGREVYTNTKGRYIKNRSMGTVFVDDDNRAFVVTRLVRVGDRGLVARRKVPLANIDINEFRTALQAHLSKFGV